jgi:hypothetical protein
MLVFEFSFGSIGIDRVVVAPMPPVSKRTSNAATAYDMPWRHIKCTNDTYIAIVSFCSLLT